MSGGALAGYLARRLPLSLLNLLLITAAVYLAIRVAPGAPTWGEDPLGRAELDAWLARCHADEAIPLGYLRWLADLVRLDLGVSLSVQPGRPVAALVAEAIPFTALLGTLAFLLTIAIALPAGVLVAWRPASLGARATAAMLYLVHALPAFWIALALQQVVAGRLGLLPALGAGPIAPPGGAMRSASYWILPTLSLTLGSLAFVIRFCREGLLTAASQPFSLAARARGAGEWRVLLRHALAGTAVPLISLAGLMLPGVLGGSVLIESIYALPGIGRLFFVAASRRDYPVVMALALLAAAATLVAHVVTDFLYRVADPRIDPTAPGGDA